MEFAQPALIKENTKGKTFQAPGFKIVYRKEGSISGDNAENVKETIYLISGKAEVTVKDETQMVEGIIMLEIPANTYHKIVALTELTFLLFESWHKYTTLILYRHEYS